jgi:cadmium resistance protein CadD (predicted permease)
MSSLQIIYYALTMRLLVVKIVNTCNFRHKIVDSVALTVDSTSNSNITVFVNFILRRFCTLCVKLVVFLMNSQGLIVISKFYSLSSINENGVLTEIRVFTK